MPLAKLPEGTGMIHETHAEVTCDGPKCLEEGRVKLNHVGTGIMHSLIDDSTKAVEAELVKQLGWIVSNGLHYCSASCQQDDDL